MKTVKHDRNTNAVLSWRQMDVEQRVGVPGGKYTDANTWLALAMGAVAVGLFYVTVMFVVPDTHLAVMFLKRPSKAVPFLILLFSLWSLAVLLLKWQKLRLQRRALELEIVPSAHEFVLAPGTAPSVLETMYEYVDDPRHFLLLNRIERALSNLSNIGRVSDVTEMLNAQAQNDEDQMESSYTVLKGFIWGIPVLGFIGTVLGLSLAIGNFGALLKDDGEGAETGADRKAVTEAASADARFDNLTRNLQDVTSGLSTAFETTLQGLIAALSIQLLMAGLRKKEESFMDDCREYCHANIISRLRLIRLDGDVTSAERQQ